MSATRSIGLTFLAAPPPYAAAAAEPRPPPYDAIMLHTFIAPAGASAAPPTHAVPLGPDEALMHLNPRWLMLLLLAPVTLGVGLSVVQGLMLGPRAELARCLERLCDTQATCTPETMGKTALLLARDQTAQEALFRLKCCTPGFIATWVQQGLSVDVCQGTKALAQGATYCVAGVALCSLAVALTILGRKARAVQVHNSRVRQDHRRGWAVP